MRTVLLLLGLLSKFPQRTKPEKSQNAGPPLRSTLGGEGRARGGSEGRPRPELPAEPSHGSFHPHEASQLTAPTLHGLLPHTKVTLPFCLVSTGRGLVDGWRAFTAVSLPGGSITGMLCIGPPSWKACRPDAEPPSSPQCAHVQLPDWEVRPPSVPQVPGPLDRM